jgi:hypothetical protein
MTELNHTVVNALLQSCGQVAWPEQPFDKEANFAVDLERLAELMDTLKGTYPMINGLTHSPEMWAISLKAKAKQIRDLQSQK